MRKCRICNKEKPLSEFPLSGTKPQTYRRWKCASCYHEHKKQRRHSITDWFETYKGTLECQECGNSDYRVLDFHHRERHQKCANISDLVKEGYSKETILQEAAKCDVLCANCHRIKTHEERSQGWVGRKDACFGSKKKRVQLPHP